MNNGTVIKASPQEEAGSAGAFDAGIAADSPGSSSKLPADCPGFKHSPEKRVSSVSNRVEAFLHYIAAAILFLYSVSHLAFTGLYDSEHDLPNLVFPFLTNRNMYFVMGIFEAAVALYCLFVPGRTTTNTTIITFVLAIVTYRFTFYWEGGVKCHCLGLLGRWLRLNQSQDRLVPIVSLIILVLTTVPWLWRLARKVILNIRFFLYMGCILCGSQALHAEPVTEVTGYIDAARYRPMVGTPFANTIVHVIFVVTLSGDSWRICATNSADPIYWGKVYYDGTNTYVLSPANGDMWLDQIPDTNLASAIVSPGPVYCSDEEDTIGLATAWLTYGFSPAKVAPDRRGLVELPLPWKVGRTANGVSAYGYSWTIGPKEARFADYCQMLRDTRLDLDDKQELLRPKSDYPTALADKNARLLSLAYRRSITNGFLAGEYTCSDWLETNGLRIPMSSALTYYLFNLKSGRTNWPHYKATLTATNVAVREETGSLLESFSGKTIVKDYRYKRSTNKRIFKYGEYTCERGDTWKTDLDPLILSNAQYYLAHGPRYDSAYSGKTFLVWTLFGVLFALPIIAMLRSKRKPQ